MISLRSPDATTLEMSQGERVIDHDGPDVSEVAAIVLAGMQAWEDSVLTRSTPRPLLPVAGQPLITHGLNWMTRSGIERISICTNHDAMSVSQILDAHLAPGVEIDYYQDILPRGPAGCARDAMERCDAELFLVTEASTVARLDVGHLLHRHRESDADVTMVVSRPDALLTARETVLEPAGVYIMSRDALSRVRPSGYQDIKEILIPELRRHGMTVCIYVADPDSVRRVAGGASYLRVNEWFLETASEDWSPGPRYERLGEGWVHDSAKVHETAQIIGPVLVQEGAVVDRGAVVLGPAVVGPRSRLGPEAVVCRSMLWPGCRIDARVRLDRCVLVDRATIASNIAVHGRVCMGEIDTVQPTPEWNQGAEWKFNRPAPIRLPSLNWLSQNCLNRAAMRTAPLRDEAAG